MPRRQFSHEFKIEAVRLTTARDLDAAQSVLRRSMLDLFSRRAVVWSMKADRDASLVMEALMMVVWQ